MTCKPFQTKSTEIGGLDTRVTVTETVWEQRS